MASFCSACGSELGPTARFCASCGAAVVSGCVTCGAELPPGAAFCPSCGADQTGSAIRAAGPEELRVITCLFADLAGFTSHTERSDPEDVRARLAAYHREVRTDVERWGGHIEKLMGDGVFAVFGVPTINEDDPERAVRAALRIQQSVSELNRADATRELSVRIGITTGEAIVQLDGPDQNERIIGDVVNTASRLEGLAPPGGVVVDERTYHAVHNVIECRPLEPVHVKGKAAPLNIWQALEARSRYGVAIAEEEQAAFVGRQEELSLLNDALERAVARRRPQLVTVSGEAGVGKSRLVREFRAQLDDRPDLVVRWRQGRSLPYGEGVTFWALAEVVKSEAGILESEPPEAARAKLQQSLEALSEARPDVDKAWLLQRLAPLAGTGGTERVERSELFSAWLQYVELLAARHPLVLLMEDLHWADESLADFLEHILDWAEDAPVLVLCTARPDWYNRRPEWGGGKREAATVGLTPLTADETSQLVASLSHRTVMPAEMQQALRERSGGNPLYLTEYVRLAEEEGWFAPGSGLGELRLPDSVQAIIASRLDLLEQEDKSLLQTAAVVGRVFWAGALTFLKDHTAHDVKEAMARLARRELVRPVRRSSMQGQDEYIFTHVLTRDVAYGQLTRSEKVRLHQETARWLEAVSGERAVDVAELLAHHYITALDLHPTENHEALDRAYRYLMLAAERTESLDMAAAARFAQRAAELATAPGDRARAMLILGQSQALTRNEVIGALSEAAALFEEAGDRNAQAEALYQRSNLEWWAGDMVAAEHDLNAALRLIEGLPPTRATAAVLAGSAARYQLSGNEEEALEAVERALEAARIAGDLTSYAKAVRVRGAAMAQLGLSDGSDDVLEALRIDLDLGNTVQALAGYNNHATVLAAVGDAREARDVIDEAIAYAEQRGAGASAEWSKMTKCEALIQLGDIGGVAALAEELIEADDARGGSQVGVFARAWKATVLWCRGDAHGAWSLAQELLPAARDIGDPQAIFPALSYSLQYAASAGAVDVLPVLIDEFVAVGKANPGFIGTNLTLAAPAMIQQGRLDELEQLLDGVIGAFRPWLVAAWEAVRGLLDEARGDPAQGLARIQPAIEIGDEQGLKFHTTRMRIDAARCAQAAGKSELAEELLAVARRDADEMGLVIANSMIDDVRAAAGW